MACKYGTETLYEAMDMAKAASLEVPGEEVEIIRKCRHKRERGSGQVPSCCEMSFIARAINGVFRQIGLYSGHYCAENDSGRPN